MSKVYATRSGFVGFNGQSVWVHEDDEYDASDPLVKAMPADMFVARPPAGAVVAEAKKQRGSRA